MRLPRRAQARPREGARTAVLLAGLFLGTVPAALSGCGDRPGDVPGLLRVGHFPNVTHAHGLVGHALTRAGKGWFESRLGPGTRVEWSVYSAGPGAMEALGAGAVDLAYVGPNPAINAHLRARGDEVRVVSGAARGGAGLVVQASGPMKEAADFRGLRIATPQLGNTQDVSCRGWLLDHGLRVTLEGGDVTVVPTANPDQLALFLRGDVAGVWTVEPWLSRLEVEGDGRLLVEEKDSWTTVLVASARILRGRRDEVRRFVRAHEELTAWLAANPAEAKALVQAELRAETRREVAPAILDRCWPRIAWRSDVTLSDFDGFVRSARRAGFLPEAADLSRLVEAP